MFSLHSPEGPAALTLSCELNGEELIYLTAELRSADGIVDTSSDVLLTAEVSGAELLGFGSGDPCPLLNYNEGKTRTWNGRAQMILRKSGAGPVSVKIADESGHEALLTV